LIFSGENLDFPVVFLDAFGHCHMVVFLKKNLGFFIEKLLFLVEFKKLTSV